MTNGERAAPGAPTERPTPRPTPPSGPRFMVIGGSLDAGPKPGGSGIGAVAPRAAVLPVLAFGVFNLSAVPRPRVFPHGATAALGGGPGPGPRWG